MIRIPTVHNKKQCGKPIFFPCRMNGFQSQYRTVLPTEFHVIALLMTQKPNSASMQFNRFMESQMLAIMETGIIHILGNTDLFALHKANLIYYTYPKASKRKRHPIYILQLLFSAVQMQKASPRRLLQIVRQAHSLTRDNVAKNQPKHFLLKSTVITAALFFLL